MRGDSGQSSAEYLAIVLLVGAVIGVGGALASASGIAHAVVVQMARGLCVVRGGDCERDRAPCVIGSRTHATDKSVRIVFIKLGGGRTLIRERRSDGTELVTDVQRFSGGGEGAVGGEIGIGGHGISLIATGSVEGRIAQGRAWLMPSSAAADRLIRQLDNVKITGGGRAYSPPGQLLLHEQLPPAPEPDVRYTDKGLDSAVEAKLGVLGLRYDTEDLMGVRSDRRSGERTFVVRRRNEAVATLSLFHGKGPQASGQTGQRYTVTVDASGRPLDLGVIEQRGVAAGLKPPRRVGSVLAGAGLPTGPAQHGVIIQTERHLDLTEPQNLAVAAAFLRAVREPHLRVGDAVVVSSALDRRLDEAGSAQARVYTAQTKQRGVHGRLAVGVELGGAATSRTDTLKLVQAASRAPLGEWQSREDCVAA